MTSVVGWRSSERTRYSGVPRQALLSVVRKHPALCPRRPGMRIGLIAGPWIPVPPPAYGGTERVVDSLARGFAEAGHEVVLAVPSDSECPGLRVPDMRKAETAELGVTLSELSHVIRAYRGMGGVDIIHDHTMAGPLYPHRPPGVPVVTTIHCQLTPPAVDIYRDI